MKKTFLIFTILVAMVNIFALSTVRKNNKAVKTMQDSLLYNAEAELKEYLENDPDHPILNYNYGLVKLKQFEQSPASNKGGLNKAIDSFERAKADTTRSNLHAIYYNQANTFYHLEDYVNALHGYQEANTFLDSTTVDPDLLFNIGNSLYKFVESNPEHDSLLTMAQDVFKNAHEVGDKAIKQKITHNLGNISFTQENYQEALAYYIEALKLNPNSEDTRINYEIALKKLAEQQENQQDQKQEDENQDQKESDQKQEQQSTDQQKEQKQQQEEAKKKQDDYDKLSEEEKEKLEAEKKLDALLQEQSRPEDQEKKPEIFKQKPTGKYW
ncbi:tetratricopeptide repeat protein [bacterium]|nr:tetratricopeptide repeat protein [bacterium]